MPGENQNYDMAQQKAQKKEQGLFGSMSGIQKVLLLVFALAIFFIIWQFLFGGIKNFYQFIFFVICFIAVVGLFIIILTFISFFLAPEFFSPKKDYFNRLVNLAIDLKPDNVYDLFFRGDKDKKRVRAGKITGLLGIPYLIGLPKLNEKDELDAKGIVVSKAGEPATKHSIILKRRIPVFETFEYGMEGDTFFIYEAGWFLFKKKHYLRCHKSLHGDLNGDVEIYDINPVPYGSLFEYPFKQIQAQAARIMLQSQLEIVLATHEHQADLISQGVDAAIYYNPFFRMLSKTQAEMPQQ